eukprot:CAMPEP_0170625766 /NCGR_PEP_ID=MMETSP0224-20130122/30951_1 /TAXON_ID=285029 /ORGANISM="Togula jolla, Strain CCCM 725" /LENGTH=323 /DNA_ID=CAMNT_0010952397 /DNA_START=20 /DNA_END=987 /DNA_ORIENTATION=-
MDPTPELIAKLHRRRRTIEGDQFDDSQWGAGDEHSDHIPHGPSSGRLAAGWAKAAAEEAIKSRLALQRPTSPGPGEAHKRGRRVQVPSWVVEGKETAQNFFSHIPFTPQWRQRRQTSGEAEPDCRLPGPDPQPQLARQLSVIEQERDSAARAAEEVAACVAARGKELYTEAARHRNAATTLRHEIQAARLEAQAWKSEAEQEEGLVQMLQERVAFTASSGGLQAVRADIERLTLELQNHADEEAKLRSRLRSLTAEAEWQAASLHELDEKMTASRVSKDVLEHLTSKADAEAEAEEDEPAPDEVPRLMSRRTSLVSNTQEQVS